MRIMSVLTAVPLAAMLVTACTAPAVPVGPKDGAGMPNEATVTVSMYSGRPDPVFALTSRQADALRECLASTEPVGAPTPFDGLGFRYFEVEGVGERKVLVAKNGAWNSDGKPIPACPAAYSILRTAAAIALPKDTVQNIPEV